MQSKKQDEWRKRIEEWKQSGLNQAAYCREHHWSLATFGYWKRKLEMRTTQLRFVPIEPPTGRIPGSMAASGLLDHGHVPLSTALVENAIRPYVIGRKAWLFSGSPAGAKASAIIYSFMETARANGWEPHAYLPWLFERLPAAETVGEKRVLLPIVTPPFKGEPE